MKNSKRANKKPGIPVMKKALLHPKWAEIIPPKAKPKAAPRGIAKEKKVTALFLFEDGKASEITAGAIAPKLASPKPTMILQNIINEKPWAIPVRQVPRLQPTIPMAMSFLRDNLSPKNPKIGDVKK
jgi:hypothetical protein